MYASLDINRHALFQYAAPLDLSLSTPSSLKLPKRNLFAGPFLQLLTSMFDHFPRTALPNIAKIQSYRLMLALKRLQFGIK